MNILIASALYPPDIADPAPYVKELATRLSTKHAVTLLVYGHIPEVIPGVTIITVPKELPALQRLRQFFITLRKLAADTDVVLVQNAPSTELPAAFAAIGKRQKFFLQQSDVKIRYTGWRLVVHRLATMVIPTTITITLPDTKPIIHPFTPVAPEVQQSYERSWTTHLSQLEKTIP